MKYLIAISVALIPMFVFGQNNLVYPQATLSEYMNANDIKGFIQSCNQDGELAIKSLIAFSLSDSINQQQIWYDETTGRGIPPYSKSTEGIDRLYASDKLKSYFWILRIYRSDYDSPKDDICVFTGSNDHYIFDYEIYNREEVNNSIKEVLAKSIKKVGGEYKLIDSHYKKNLSSTLIELEQSFDDWVVQMKEKGLKYMQEQNISPIEKSKYKIFTPKKYKY